MEIEKRLQVGIDVGRSKLDLALLGPEGELLLKHRSFRNSRVGYQQIRELLLATLDEHDFEGLDLAAEATSYYWLPLFWELSQDPALADYHPRQFLINATWVKWFKKSLSPNHKSDESDPYYIGAHLRSLPNQPGWHLDERWLSLRVATRLHAHLTKSLTREKSYYQLILFLAHSAYQQAEPFSDTFGVLSQTLLNQPETLEELAQLTDTDLAHTLDALSGHRLRQPQETAVRLKQAVQDSFPPPQNLQPALQQALQHLARVIQALQEQLKVLDTTLQDQVRESYPEVAWLQSVPGVGLVYASGIASEIASLERFETPLKWDQQRNGYRKRSLRDIEDAVAKFAGLWWPQNASGQFKAEERPLSKRGNAYLRYYLIQAADHMRREIPSYAHFYQVKYAQATKHQHKRALVLTARKAVGLFVGLLHRQEVFRLQEDPSI